MNSSEANILVIGGGGREHAIANKLRRDGVKKIYCAPGNAGTELIATNVNLDLNNFDSILEFLGEKDIHLTVVGPEDPLHHGLVNFFQDNQQLIIGPTFQATRLETSKVFARHLMDMNKIPQPEYRICRDIGRAEEAKSDFGLPIVVKAYGLAVGKGALVCQTEFEWKEALQIMFVDKKFGSANDIVLVEECLVGEELSVFALCDDLAYQIIGTAQDHKRLLDDDLGPNTGGMGAYSPTPLSTPALLAEVKKLIIKPILSAMSHLGYPYQGFLYVGLMLTGDGPKVIEFNVRLGDPETQVILPLIKSSLFDLLYQTAQGKLKEAKPIEFNDLFAVTVVKVAGGYPDKYDKGNPIIGLAGLYQPDLDNVIQAGTKKDEYGRIVTNGGRVISLTGFGSDLKQAIANAYHLAYKVNFKDEHFRRDIGRRGLSYEKVI